MYEHHINHKPKTYNGYTHTQNRKKSKHNTEDSHQIRKEESKNKKELQNKQKTINKMIISAYLSIIKCK